MPQSTSAPLPPSCRPLTPAPTAPLLHSAEYMLYFLIVKAKDIRYLTEAAVIAALYIVLTYLAWGFDLASGAIQCRVSEALCVLPYFTSAAVPGLSVGCVLANFLLGSPLPDVIFGSLATLLGACGSYLLRKNRYAVSIPPVIANALIIPLVLRYAYEIPDALPFLMLTVGAGELIACVVFGQLLITALLPVRRTLFEAG